MAPLHEAARSQDAPAVTDDDALRRRDAKSHQGEVLPKVAPQLCERSNQSGGRGLEQESPACGTPEKPEGRLLQYYYGIYSVNVKVTARECKKLRGGTASTLTPNRMVPTARTPPINNGFSAQSLHLTGPPAALRAVVLGGTNPNPKTQNPKPGPRRSPKPKPGPLRSPEPKTRVVTLPLQESWVVANVGYMRSKPNPARCQPGARFCR